MLGSQFCFLECQDKLMLDILKDLSSRQDHLRQYDCFSNIVSQGTCIDWALQFLRSSYRKAAECGVLKAYWVLRFSLWHSLKGKGTLVKCLIRGHESPLSRCLPSIDTWVRGITPCSQFFQSLCSGSKASRWVQRCGNTFSNLFWNALGSIYECSGEDPRFLLHHPRLFHLFNCWCRLWC